MTLSAVENLTEETGWLGSWVALGGLSTLVLYEPMACKWIPLSQNAKQAVLQDHGNQKPAP